jgi:hypothetical protein
MVIHHIYPDDGGRGISDTLVFISTLTSLVAREDFSTFK